MIHNGMIGYCITHYEIAKKLGPTHAIVFGIIVNHTILDADPDDKALIKQKEFINRVKISIRTLYRVIKDLNREGYIKVRRGTGQVNEYSIGIEGRRLYEEHMHVNV